jgi:hypothetical protein
MNATPAGPAMPELDLPHTIDDEPTLYRDRHVTITPDWVRTPVRQFALAQLRHVRILRAPLAEFTVNWTILAVALAVAVARLWDRLDAQGWAGAVVLLAAAAALALPGWLRPREAVVVAELYGTTTVILIADRLRPAIRATRTIRRAQQPARR